MLPAPKVGSEEQIIQSMNRVLIQLGLDVENGHLKGTAKRFIKALLEMGTPEKWVFTTFHAGEGDHGAVLVRDIPIVSLCAHHLFPWHGVAHVAYIPKPGGQLAGLSKLARTIDDAATGFTIQEEVGKNAVDFLMEKLDPMGVAVIIKASHTCMEARGVKAHGSLTVTSALRGVYFDDIRARDELYSMLKV